MSAYGFVPLTRRMNRGGKIRRARMCAWSKSSRRDEIGGGSAWYARNCASSIAGTLRYPRRCRDRAAAEDLLVDRDDLEREALAPGAATLVEADRDDPRAGQAPPPDGPLDPVGRADILLDEGAVLAQVEPVPAERRREGETVGTEDLQLSGVLLPGMHPASESRRRKTVRARL